MSDEGRQPARLLAAGSARPRLEGVLRVGQRRRLGFADYGDAAGRPVLWFHGTPGGRRQVPPEVVVLARERGVRVVAIDRPGAGLSTPHLHTSVLAAAGDVEQVVHHLGIGRFACVGLSGGGPYALACAHRFADRVVGAAVLGGVAPTTGPDAAPGGLVGALRPFAPLVAAAQEPLARAGWLAVRALVPVRSQVFDLYARLSPPGDRAVFTRPEMKRMFVNDLLRAYRRQMRAPLADLVLFWREWGFALDAISVPVHFWHGDADNIVPLAHAHHMATRVPNATLTVRPRQAHIGMLDAGREILDTLLPLWDAPDVHPRSLSAGQHDRSTTAH